MRPTRYCVVVLTSWPTLPILEQVDLLYHLNVRRLDVERNKLLINQVLPSESVESV